MRIPFDQGGHGAKAQQRGRIQVPDGIGDGGAMVVDHGLRRQQMAAQVQFAHAARRDGLHG